MFSRGFKCVIKDTYAFHDSSIYSPDHYHHYPVDDGDGRSDSLGGFANFADDDVVEVGSNFRT